MFQPDRLLEHVKTAAQNPVSTQDKPQLSSKNMKAEPPLLRPVLSVRREGEAPGSQLITHMKHLSTQLQAVGLTLCP